MKPFLLVVISVLLALVGVVGADAPATQPTTQPFDKEAAAKLIGQLDDDDFAVREAATKKLIDMGDGVRPMLAEKAKEKGLDRGRRGWRQRDEQPFSLGGRAKSATCCVSTPP
jgi:hypothetical protein